MIELLRATMNNLRRKRLRTLLTVCGIAVGTLLISLVSFLGDAGKAVVGDELKSMGLDGISISSDDAEALRDDTLVAIRNAEQVQAAMPLSILFAGAYSGRFDGEIMGCGIDAGADQVISLQELHGRLLSRGDISGENMVCVVDETLAWEAYGRENVVGKTLLVRFNDREEEFQIVGVSKAGSSVLQNVAGYMPSMVYFPYTTLRALTGDESFDQIAVRVQDGGDVDTVRENLARLLSYTDTYDATYVLEDLASQREKLNSLMDIISLVLKIISAVSLLVAGMSIMTIMLVSVHERTKEIGIKKAIGATGGRVMTEFLTEAVLLTLGGSVCGILLAVMATLLGGALSGVQIAVSISTILGVTLFSLTLGVVFGVYPAKKAANLPPAEALLGAE